MRAQITAYLHPETKAWLRKYARQNRLKESEIVRILVEREQEIEWFAWAKNADDPARGVSAPMPKKANRLPPRANKSPAKQRGRKRTKLRKSNRYQ